MSREEIELLLAASSVAWRRNRFDELATYFDVCAVIAVPSAGTRVAGREQVVESYRQFMNRVEITEYRESAPEIDVWGTTAVAIIRWEMAWRFDGRDERESGHDVFVLQRAEHSWHIVWRGR